MYKFRVTKLIQTKIILYNNSILITSILKIIKSFLIFPFIKFISSISFPSSKTNLFHDFSMKKQFLIYSIIFYYQINFVLFLIIGNFRESLPFRVKLTYPRYTGRK